MLSGPPADLHQDMCLCSETTDGARGMFARVGAGDCCPIVDVVAPDARNHVRCPILDRKYQSRHTSHDATTRLHIEGASFEDLSADVVEVDVKAAPRCRQHLPAT